MEEDCPCLAPPGRLQEQDCLCPGLPGPLSIETWLKVASYLSQAELCTLAGVSSTFLRLARDPSLWRQATSSSFMSHT